MASNNIDSCVTILTGDLKFDDGNFLINDIELDGDEMSIDEEVISCMICTSHDNFEIK